MQVQIAFFYHLNYMTSEVSSNDETLQTETGSVTLEVLVCSSPDTHTPDTHARTHVHVLAPKRMPLPIREMD